MVLQKYVKHEKEKKVLDKRRFIRLKCVLLSIVV